MQNIIPFFSPDYGPICGPPDFFFFQSVLVKHALSLSLEVFLHFTELDRRIYILFLPHRQKRTTLLACTNVAQILYDTIK